MPITAILFGIGVGLSFFIRTSDKQFRYREDLLYIAGILVGIGLYTPFHNLFK